MKLITPSLLLTIQIYSCLISASTSQHGSKRIADRPFGRPGSRPGSHRTGHGLQSHHRLNKLAGLPHDKNGLVHPEPTKSPVKRKPFHPKNKTLSKSQGRGFDNKHGSGSGEYQKLKNKCSRGLNHGWTKSAERGNRSAVQQFISGEKLHITGKHPDNWMFCVDVPEGASQVYPIHIKECLLDKNEQWMFYNPAWAPDSSWAVIKAVSTDECFDVLSEDTEDGTPVGVFDCFEESENQLWKVVPQNDGTVRLKSYSSCKCLTIKSLDKRACGKGHVLEISECDGNPRIEQDWTLRKVAKHSITLYEHPNYQGFHFSLHSNGDCVDVPTYYDDPVSSLNVHGSCWVVFRERNCVGPNRTFKPDEDGKESAKMKGFLDVIKSAVPCSVQVRD